MKTKAPEIPHDEAYDRAYYEAYGIDPEEVMPKERRREPGRKPRPMIYNGETWLNAYWVGDAVAVVVEDPNGPHPTAYEYEHITRGRWTLYQAYPLEPGRAWEWARERRLRPMDIANGTNIGGALYRDVRREDISQYYTEEPAPPMRGERMPEILELRAQEEAERKAREGEKPGRKSAIISPEAFDPSAEREEPRPERKRRGGLFAALGISFEI